MPHFHVKQLFLILLFLNLVSCASKNYKNDGVANFEVVYKDDGSFYHKNKLELFLYRLDSSCQSEFLGKVDVKSGISNHIALQTGVNYVVIPNLLRKSWFGQTKVLDLGPFYFVPNTKMQTRLDVELEGDDVGNNYYSIQGEKKNELKKLFNHPKCEYEISYTRVWSSFMARNSQGFSHNLSAKKK